VVYIVHAAMKRDRRYRQSVGSRLPAHATSTGHVMLANLPAAAQAAFLAQAPFPRFTPHTPGTAEELGAILQRVREQGYAAVCDVIEYGVVAVAVPIRDAHGRTIAAINCSADTTRATEAEMRATRLPRLREAAAEIGEALARFPALAHSVG
jgi:IclR family pca regulon transcriptional regulator